MNFYNDYFKNNFILEYDAYTSIYRLTNEKIQKEFYYYRGGKHIEVIDLAEGLILKKILKIYYDYSYYLLIKEANEIKDTIRKLRITYNIKKIYNENK